LLKKVFIGDDKVKNKKLEVKMTYLHKFYL